MPDEMPEPARWSDSPSDSRTAEQAIGVSFRRVREATGFELRWEIRRIGVAASFEEAAR